MGNQGQFSKMDDSDNFNFSDKTSNSDNQTSKFSFFGPDDEDFKLLSNRNSIDEDSQKNSSNENKTVNDISNTSCGLGSFDLGDSVTKSLDDAYGVEGKDDSLSVSDASHDHDASHDLNFDFEASSEEADDTGPLHESFLNTQVPNTDNEVDSGGRVTFDFNSRGSKTVSFGKNSSWKVSENSQISQNTSKSENSRMKSIKTAKKSKTFTLDRAYFQKLTDKQASIQHSELEKNLDACTKILKKTNIFMKKINHQTLTHSTLASKIPIAINDINTALNSIQPILK